MHSKEMVTYPYENVIMSATSARGDLASLRTTAARDNGWQQAETSSDDVACTVDDAEGKASS